MATDAQNQLLGPEIVGMRITVYNLLPDFLDPTQTEDKICRFYNLTPEQVAAARAYVFRNLDTVLERHLEIEARNAAGNPNPEELAERFKQTHANLLRFKQWLEKRDAEDANWRARAAERQQSNPDPPSTYQEWRAQQDSSPVNESSRMDHRITP